MTQADSRGEGEGDSGTLPNVFWTRVIENEEGTCPFAYTGVHADALQPLQRAVVLVG